MQKLTGVHLCQISVEMYTVMVFSSLPGQHNALCSQTQYKSNAASHLVGHNKSLQPCRKCLILLQVSR